MPDLVIAKAQPTTKDQPTPEAHIHITGELPEFDYREGFTLLEPYYDEQARQLERALAGSLPGGIYDRLLGHMLARRGSNFRVPHAPKED